MTVFLYDMKRRVELTLRETGGSMNWNLPMNTNDFRVFKDVQNTIEFVVRNTDRKPINMMDRTAKILFYDQRLNKLLWTKALRVINEAKGICKLIIEPDVMADWLLQTYSYQVVVTNPDGGVQMLYVDANESQRGFFELLQGPKFEPLASQTVTYEQLMPMMVTPNDTRVSYRITSAIPGSLQTGNTGGIHTIAAYLENFTGRLVIQGSVETGTPSDWDWYDIQTHTFDHESGLRGFSLDANLSWIRARVYNANDQDPTSTVTLPSDQGKIAKLVFRN
jgi:hypothetical protein